MLINWKDIRSYENSQNTAFEEVVCQLAHNENQGKGKYVRVKAPDGGVESYLILDDGTEIGWQAKYFFDIQDAQFRQIQKSFQTAIKKHPKLTKYYVCCPVDLQDPRLPDKKYSKDRWDKFVEESIKLATQEEINIEIVYWGAFELNNMLQKPMNHGMTKFWFGGDDFSDAWFNSQIKTSLTNLGARYSQQLNVEVDEIAAFFDAIQRNSRAKYRVFEQLNELDKALHNLYDRRQSQRLKFDEQNKKLALAIEECWNSVRNNSVHITFEDIKAGLLSLIKNIEEHPPTFDDREQEALFNQSFYSIKDILDGLNQPIFKLFYSPYLIVHGDAGTGKSHLLGDFSDNLMSQNKKCVFILGQSLTSSNNPWTQILKDELRLGCKEDEFLGVLNTIGQAQQERVPFVIDALNEGNGRQFWKNHIAGFIEKFKGYPWVALVLSIRSEYKDDILHNVQDDINSKIISKVEHYGFQRNVFTAIRSFFNHYNLALPREPLMVPEFTNPLFLKIYCKYREQSKADLEFTGLPDVFESYFSIVNKILSDNFSYRLALRYVQKTLHHLAKAIFHNNQHSISYEHAMEIVAQNTTHSIDSDVFLQALISENVLIAYHNQQAKEEILHFSFERFQDYLTAQFICEENDSADVLRELLSHEEFYGVSYKSKYLSEGILSILSYLIPAKFKVEFYELFDDENIHENSSISHTFIDSLYWRNTDDLNIDSSKNFLNKALSHNYSFDKFIDTLYQVAGKENHPFNADFLHGWLAKQSLADRDSLWTTHISAYLEDNSAIDVLIDWASESGFSENLSDESRLLIARAVSWIFTSTNIRLRDKATIGLTRLLQNNLKIAKKLILSFKEVDDPYVHERIMASTYGAILSSRKHDGLELICNYLINEFFAQDEVFPNVLVRDYSRNIVEYVHHKGKLPLNEEQLKLARPPYDSAFPDSLPTVEEIDDKYANDYQDERIPKHHFAQDLILSSMATEYGRGVCGYGDFGRYVFEAHLGDWDSVDIDKLSNFAVQLIFEEYGYDPEKHGEFDTNRAYSNRSENIIERIGKKYQWMSMYEVVARLADNNKMTAPETRWTDNKMQIWYNGSIEPSFREFDPTFIPASSTENRIIEEPKYDGWDDDYEKWVISKDDLINSESLITCQYDAAEWLTLKRYIDLKPEKKMGDNRIFSRYQNFWYHIHAYLVKAEDFDSILSNLKGKNFMGRWIPQPKEYHNDIFNLEFHWSPLLKVYEHDYYGGSGWQEIRQDSFDSSSRSLGKVYCCSENHIFDGIRNSDLRYNISAPTQLIFEALNLKNDKCSGSWLNENNELIAFDTSLYGNENSNLIIKKKYIEKIEKTTNSKIIWTVLAEKVAMYENSKSTEKRLQISGVYYLKDGVLTGADDYFFK